MIEECFQHIGRIMKPGGWFDFTFDRTEGKEHQVLREDFYYRTETLMALADRHGLARTFMDDWERLRHRQSKIRITLLDAEPVGERVTVVRPQNEQHEQRYTMADRVMQDLR